MKLVGRVTPSTHPVGRDLPERGSIRKRQYKRFPRHSLTENPHLQVHESTTLLHGDWVWSSHRTVKKAGRVDRSRAVRPSVEAKSFDTANTWSGNDTVGWDSAPWVEPPGETVRGRRPVWRRPCAKGLFQTEGPLYDLIYIYILNAYTDILFGIA